MESESFANVWQAYQAGDAAARDRILAAFAPRVAGLVRKYLRDPNLREDVEQSAWGSVMGQRLTTLRKIASSDDLWQLIAAITLRHCGKHNKRRFRAHGRGPTVAIHGTDAGTSSQPGGFVPVDRDPPPDEQVAIADLIAECNRGLSERQQRILAERLAGMERSEIARCLEISIPTVDRELAKIKATLAALAGETIAET